MKNFCHYGIRLNGFESVRLGVAVALIDEFNRLLLELRSDVSMWGLTGGRLDPGETPLACGCREVKEETGLTYKEDDLNLLNIYGDPNDGRILQYPDACVHLIDIVYYTRVNSHESLSISDESISLKFFNASSLPNQIVSPALKPITDLVARGLVR